MSRFKLEVFRVLVEDNNLFLIGPKHTFVNFCLLSEGNPKDMRELFKPTQNPFLSKHFISLIN